MKTTKLFEKKNSTYSIKLVKEMITLLNLKFKEKCIENLFPLHTKKLSTL